VHPYHRVFEKKREKDLGEEKEKMSIDGVVLYCASGNGKKELTRETKRKRKRKAEGTCRISHYIE